MPREGSSRVGPVLRPELNDVSERVSVCGAVCGPWPAYVCMLARHNRTSSIVYPLVLAATSTTINTYVPVYSMCICALWYDLNACPFVHSVILLLTRKMRCPMNNSTQRHRQTSTTSTSATSMLAVGNQYLYHGRGPELARPGRASSIFRAGPGVIELARLVGLAQGRSSWLEKSSWPADGRAGSTHRASSTPIELARSDRAGTRISSWLDAPSWLEAVRAGSESRAGSPLVELAQPLELARPESSWLDQIEWASRTGALARDPRRSHGTVRRLLRL